MSMRYFGRTGGVGRILAIYRVPAELYDGKLDLEHFASMELLLVSGVWKKGDNERIERDWMTGWFGEDDEINEDEMQALLEKWNVEGWPARR
jgi:hypothetical protein